MVRCTAKTAVGRRCKKSGTRDGLCHIHESAAPVAIDPRRSRGGGVPALDYQPQRPEANREGPNDGVHPEFIALSRRRADLIARVQTLSLEIHRQLGRRNTAWLALLSRNLATMVTPLQQIRTRHNSRVADGLTRDLNDIQQRLERGEVEVREEIRNHQRQQNVLEQARQRAREAVAEQLRAEEERLARAAQLREDLRLRPVVFRRDPEGGIDLRAFAEDAQSVHRSSVQNATHKAVVELLSRPAPPAEQDTLPEIVGVFNTPTSLRWASPDARDTVVTELTDNYFNATAFNIAYGRVVDYIWAYIRGHAEKTELVQRLAEELYEGRGMCANGKMARLINVLQGYDESLTTAAPRELFQQRIAELSSKPAAERESAARALFAEFRIPIAEHAVWLEPLLEA